MTATIRPLGQRSETEYDAVGRIVKTTDFNGEVIAYQYNDLNQLISKNLLTEGTLVEFSYSEGGKRESVTDERGTTLYDYNERGQLLSRTEPDGAAVSYTYYPSGQIATVTTPSGVTTYQYTAFNQLSEVTTSSGDRTTYSYDVVGNLIRTKRPNGTSQNYEYDDLNRVTYQENTDSSGNIIASYRYTYDELGNKTAVEENTGRRVDYRYDDLNRLVQETITDAENGNRTISYTFDAVGNRLTKDDSINGLTTYTYDSNDRLLSETTGGITTTYSYDQNGNLIREESDSQQINYTWSSENRLVNTEIIDFSGTQNIDYKYDADGIRVAKTLNGDETRYLIDANRQYAQVLEEYNSDMGSEVSYVYGNELISQTRDGETSFYLYDSHSGVRQLTNGAGQASDSYIYDAYGNVLSKIGDTENNYLYRGEQSDRETGLQYLRARYNDLNSGRFISEDPFSGVPEIPISRHRYLYANANPNTFIDPSGNFSIGEVASASAILSGLASVSQTTFSSLLASVGVVPNMVWDINSAGVGVTFPILVTAGAEFLNISGVNNRGEKLTQGFYRLKIGLGVSSTLDLALDSGSIGTANAALPSLFKSPSFFAGGFIGLDASAVVGGGYSLAIAMMGFGVSWSYPQSFIPSDFGYSLGLGPSTGLLIPATPALKYPTFTAPEPSDIPPEVLPYV